MSQYSVRDGASRNARIGTANSRSSNSSKSTVESGFSASSTNTDNIRVIVRCRPLNEREIQRREDSAVHADGSNCLKIVSNGPSGTQSQKSFRFNRVFLGESSQKEFFQGSGITTLLDSCLDGYAATAFAYGQTGSGKTYSMSGYEENVEGGNFNGEADGLIPRSVRYLFQRIQDQSNNKNGSDSRASRGSPNYRIMASFCEIYNEQVFDLLSLKSVSLPVRWNPAKGFFVEDLLLVQCETMQDVMDVLSEGHRNRRVGSHDLNKDSSRSHSMLTLHIESETIDPDDGHSIIKFGKMVFVDLAGSERLKDTKSVGQTLTETGAINKSLFTLANVISALSTAHAEGGGAKPLNASQSHIPYRDSKLTKLLMDSLGGTSLALMVCCCSPASGFYEETLNTLKYATRAAKIQNKPTLQLDGKEQLIARLREEIKLLKMENEYLREQNGLDPRDREAGFGHSQANSSSVASLTPRGSPKSHSVASFSHQLPKIDTQSNGLVPPGLGLSALTPSIPIEQAPTSGRTSPKSAQMRAAFQERSSQQQQQQQQQQQADGPSIDGILAGYQREISRLKSENREIRTREVIAERGFHSSMIENEALSKKLEHLEEIFVHDDKDSASGIRRTKGSNLPSEQTSAEIARLKQENQRLAKSLENFQPLHLENAQLNRVIQALRQREASLMQSIKALQSQNQQHYQDQTQRQQQQNFRGQQHSQSKTMQRLPQVPATSDHQYIGEAPGLHHPKSTSKSMYHSYDREDTYEQEEEEDQVEVEQKQDFLFA